jgi:DNA-directed RNA polymerase subunit RPC12/RpoP
MIKIIKPGFRKEVECLKCGALLSYDEQEDVQKGTSKTTVLSCSGKGSVTRSEKYIICPQCKNKIVIDAVR